MNVALMQPYKLFAYSQAKAGACHFVRIGTGTVEALENECFILPQPFPVPGSLTLNFGVV